MSKILVFLVAVCLVALSVATPHHEPGHEGSAHHTDPTHAPTHGTGSAGAVAHDHAGHAADSVATPHHEGSAHHTDPTHAPAHGTGSAVAAGSAEHSHSGGGHDHSSHSH